MPSRIINIREWTCDGCDATMRTNSANQELPVGWTMATTSIANPFGGKLSKGLDLCPACSKESANAIKCYKASMGQ